MVDETTEVVVVTEPAPARAGESDALMLHITELKEMIRRHEDEITGFNNRFTHAHERINEIITRIELIEDAQAEEPEEPEVVAAEPELEPEAVVEEAVVSEEPTKAEEKPRARKKAYFL